MNAPAGIPVHTIVHLMRHGEVHNPTGVLYGRMPDFHLSERGREMAETVGAHLGDHDVTVVVASPLDRAQESASPIASAHGLSILTDTRVIEAGNYFEGKTFGVGDGSLKYPKHWLKLINPFKPSWGEPYREIAERMVAAIDEARGLARGHEAVIVSHQLPVWTVRSKLEGRHLWHDPRNRQCSLASLTSLTFAGDELESITYSEPAAALLPGARKTAGA